MPICGIIEKCLDNNESIFLFKPCCKSGHLIVKTNKSCNPKEHMVLEKYKKFRITKDQEILYHALMISHLLSTGSCCVPIDNEDLPFLNCVSMNAKISSIPFLTQLETFLYFNVKRYQLGLIKKSSPTNLFKIVPAHGEASLFLYYLVCNCYREEKSVIKESLVIIKKPPSDDCYYGIKSSELQVLAENKTKPDFPPNIIIKGVITVRDLFGRDTGDHSIDEWLISDFLGKEGSIIWLGDVKGFASIRLYNLKPKYPMPIFSDASNRFLRIRMYFKNILLKVDDRGQHFLYFINGQTQMHFEYWSMRDNVLAKEQIPYDFLPNSKFPFTDSPKMTPIHQKGQFSLVFKFHFLPLKKIPNGYLVIDKIGNSAIIEDTLVLILQQWHLGIGQVIRMNYPVRILLQKLLPYCPNDPVQIQREWSVLRGIFEPFVAICMDDLKHNYL
jgi:hypothetical protein